MSQINQIKLKNELTSKSTAKKRNKANYSRIIDITMN